MNPIGEDLAANSDEATKVSGTPVVEGLSSEPTTESNSILRDLVEEETAEFDEPSKCAYC
jgi:hypothetical protein